MDYTFTRKPNHSKPEEPQDWQPRRNKDGWYYLGWGRTSASAKLEKNYIMVKSAEMVVFLLLAGSWQMQFQRASGGPRVSLNADATLLNGKSMNEWRHLLKEYREQENAQK